MSKSTPTYRTARFGPCAYDRPHQAHTFVTGKDNAGNTLLHECHGKYSHCSNCDDMGCMDCVMRVWHDTCAWTCPFCEKGEAAYLEEEGYEVPEAPGHKGLVS